MTTQIATTVPTTVLEMEYGNKNASTQDFFPAKPGDIANAVQAEHELTNVGLTHGATEEGMDWMSWCLDPFKDTKRRKGGYPDSVTTKNVIQVVTQSMDVSTVNGSSNNWDCNISLSPLATGINMQAFTLNTVGSPNLIDTSTFLPPPTSPFGGVEVRQDIAGNPLNTNTLIKNLPLPQSYVQHGNIRVIGQAMEIHNTTSALNVQGAVTVYRAVSPPLDETNGMTLYASASSSPFLHGNSNMYTLPEVPRLVAQADNMADSKSWKASEGVYCVSTMCSDRSPPFDATLMSVMPLYLDPKGAIAWCPSVQNLPGGVLGFVPDTPPLFAPFNLSGAYFTGLSPQTTLRVRVRWILERFPDFNNSDLITLAEDPSPYDPQAIEIYSRTAMALPSGVQAKDNDLGAYVKTVADIAEMAGVPFAGLISKGIDAYNTISNSKIFAPQGGVDIRPNGQFRLMPATQVRKNRQPQQRSVRQRQPKVVEVFENVPGPHAARNRRKREKQKLKKAQRNKQMINLK